MSDQSDVDKVVELLKTGSYAYEDPPEQENPARVRNRTPHEAGSPAAEESNLKTHGTLDDYFAGVGDARAYNRELFAHLFESGRKGTYQTRTQSLIEKTAKLLPRE